MVGEGRGHDGDVARGDQNGALPEVSLQHRADIFRDDVRRAQQIGNGAVAVAADAFGGKHGLVDGELASGKPAERLADVFEGAVALGLADQARAGDRAGVDHRIEGMVVGIEPDRIEGGAGGLDANSTLYPRRAERIQRQRQRQREHEGF